ncbi:protein translocase subunit SecD [Pararhodospirillum photometricum]|nr:protein translocase subunit SecD [Pararhodospirillum photometricum]
MLYFSPLKRWAIILVCLLGVLFSAPSFLPHGFLPSWLPQHRVTLGLDLQGGSHLMLAVDRTTVARERVSVLQEDVRGTLRGASQRYADLTTTDRGVTFTSPAPTEAEAALRSLTKGTDAAAVQLKRDGERLTLTIPETALNALLDGAVKQSIEIVRRRIDETGVMEPIIAQQGPDRIVVQLPGLSDPGRIKRLLGQTAKMTFHLVSPDSQPGPGSQMLPMVEGGQIVIMKKVEVDGSHLTDARPGMDQRTGQWVVNFTFDSQGGRRFAETTTAAVGRPFAIVLDGKVISAPVIREPITGGRGQISGNFTATSANDLSVLLRAGALPVPLQVVEERTVGPDLGADSIRAGIMSILIGLVLVVGYMALTYGLFGLFANVALIFNLALTIGALSLLQATLTLPGIAGLLLSVGMAVDANILINERIREEIRKGQAVGPAMEAGFRRAFTTITDANVTTLIKMAILYAIGTGSVRGFAVTISLGILASMFTAVTVTRLMMVTWYRRTRPKTLPMALRKRLIPDEPAVPFMRGRVVGLAMSVLLSTASLVLFFTPGLNYGVDFAGGTVMEIRTERPAEFGPLRESLEGLGIGPVQIQEFGSPQDVLIRFQRQPGSDAAQAEAVQKVQATLQQIHPDTVVRKVDSVGASVSDELFQGGMIALGLAAVAMLFYIWVRFEWQFGVGAVVTMLLDVTKTVGFFAITGMQFNLTAIAAILTIMGYSINDKVVVYDRVRENLRRYRKMPLRDLIDKSINETMSRTIGTSLALFLATVPLALFGGEALREFALVLLFGVVLATSSSIFIAAPILLFLGEHRLRGRRSGEDEDPS